MKKILIEHENGFLFAQAIFTIVGLFMTAYTLLHGTVSRAIIFSVTLYILLAIYTCWGYKKPHGNYLRILGLLLAGSLVYTGLTVVSPVEAGIAKEIFGDFFTKPLSYFFLLAACSVAYVSGRLDKYKSNTVILIIAITFLIISVSMYQGVMSATLDLIEATQQTRFAIHVASYNPPILVTTFAIAYLTRYETHINAGLGKDPKVFKE